MALIGNMQLGKQGLTENFFKTLESYFKTHKNVKISVLRSCSERQEMKKLANKIVEKLGPNYTAKVIGFTIALKKWRKARE